MTTTGALDEIDRWLSDLERLVRSMHRARSVGDPSYVEMSESMHRLQHMRLGRRDHRVPATAYDDAFLRAQYHQALALYEKDDLEVEHALLRPICDRLAKGEYAEVSSELRLMLLCGYSAVTSRLGLPNEFAAHTEHTILHTATADAALDAYCKRMYALMLLEDRRYASVGPYMPYLQPVTATAVGITPATASFDAAPDAPSKCVLIYFSGGIGDKVMFARFVAPLSVAFSQHRYVVVVDDGLLWIVRQVWQTLSNVRIVPFSQRSTIPAFHHHLNINALPALLGVTYETIPSAEYLRAITTCDRGASSRRPMMMLHPTKRNVIINWIGTHTADVIDRGIPLDDLEPLLTRTSDYIHWIAICPNLSPEDAERMERMNVATPNAAWDQVDAFRDSIALMRRVDLVLSIDTSTLHVAGSIGVPTWGILILGCDWRWRSSDDTSSWYPRVRLFRQTRRRHWADVLQRIEVALQESR